MVSVETKHSLPPATDKYALPPQLDQFLKSPVGKYAVKYLIDRVYTHAPERLFEWKGQENIQTLKDPFFDDKKIVLAVTHRSHGDGAETVKAIEKIDEEVPGRFTEKVYTVAGSMKREQGPLMAALWVNGVKPFFEKKGIIPDEVVSENDVVERKMIKPDNNGELTKESMLNVDALTAVHLEGLTRGGKTNQDTGEYFGLQPIDDGFRGILRMQVIKLRIPTYLLPLSIEGSDYYFDPNIRGFSKDAARELAKMLTVGEGTMVGQLEDYLAKCFFGEVQRPKRGQVTFGKPVSLQGLYTNRYEFPDNIMRQLAMISSEQYLGDYGRQLLAAK